MDSGKIEEGYKEEKNTNQRGKKKIEKKINFQLENVMMT